MNFITGLFSQSLKMGMRGLQHPMIAGGVIGGAAGAIGSDANTLTQRLQDTGEGIATGVALGALTPFTGAGVYQKLWGQKENIWKAGKYGTKKAWQAGLFAFEHPVALAAVGTGLYGVTRLLGSFGQTGRSPTMQGMQVRADYNQQAMQAEEVMSQFVQVPGVVGPAPQYNQQMQRFRNSTSGLVQGLHRGRHS